MIRLIFHWFEIHTGSDNEAGPWYGFWSGFGSDIGEITLIGAIFAVWRHHKCHSQGCRHLGKHPVVGTPYKVCRKCHPHVPDAGATMEEIHEARRKVGP